MGATPVDISMTRNEATAATFNSKALPMTGSALLAMRIKIDLKESTLISDIWTKYSFGERQGRRLYNKYCVVCHGLNGEGDGFNSYNLSPKPKSLADSAYNKALSDESIKNIIAHGGAGMNRSVLMPSYQNTLNENEIQYLVQYLRTFSQ